MPEVAVAEAAPSRGAETDGVGPGGRERAETGPGWAEVGGRLDDGGGGGGCCCCCCCAARVPAVETFCVRVVTPIGVVTVMVLVLPAAPPDPVTEPLVLATWHSMR